MITLKDYIGKIYKEVTNAKVQSDIETLAIAQEYVADPMLRHFSVPNIRIKDVELNIPVAIDTTQPTRKVYTQTEVQSAFEKSFEETFYYFYAGKVEEFESKKPQMQSIAEANASEATAQLKSAQASLDEDPNAYSKALDTVANRFAGESYQFVDGEVQRELFNEQLIPKVQESLALQPLAINDLPVIVETQQLKSINDPASIINIKVTMVDDAMEWTNDVDENGNATQVLTYE